MTADQIEAIRARLRAATEEMNAGYWAHARRAMVTHAPTDIASLLEALKERDAEIVRLKAELTEATTCRECRGTGRMIFSTQIASNGDWVDKDEEGECICCDGSGADR